MRIVRTLDDNDWLGRVLWPDGSFTLLTESIPGTSPPEVNRARQRWAKRQGQYDLVPSVVFEASLKPERSGRVYRFRDRGGRHEFTATQRAALQIMAAFADGRLEGADGHLTGLWCLRPRTHVVSLHAWDGGDGGRVVGDGFVPMPLVPVGADVWARVTGALAPGPGGPPRGDAAVAGFSARLAQKLGVLFGRKGG